MTERASLIGQVFHAKRDKSGEVATASWWG